MTSYVLGVLSAIIVRTIKMAFPSFGSSPPFRFEHTNPTLPTAQRICSSPIPQIQVQATIGLRPTAPREIKYQLETEKCPVELPTVQSPPRTNHGETKVEDIMQEVERLLSSNRVSNEEKEALTTHQRGYFSHHSAAKYQLSQGDMDGFRRELKCARYELGDLEEILHHYRSGLQKHLRGLSVA